MNSSEKKLLAPPKYADRFLEWYCADRFLEEVQGDLHELYELRTADSHHLSASVQYWWDVIRFCRPYLWKRRPAYQSRGPIMWQNYFKMAYRSFNRQKGYSFLNVLGLAIGMACCILIFLYVQDELSYDRYHQNAGQIYRVIGEEINEGQSRQMASTYNPMAPALENDFPEIIHTVRFFPFKPAVQFGSDKKFQEDAFFFADSTVFSMFDFPFLRGNPNTALDEPYSIVVTASAARKYFGNENPIGKILTLENNYDFKVTAVLADVPGNSHFTFDFLASMSSAKQMMDYAFESHAWHWPPVYNYLMLPENYSPEQINARFPAFIEKHIGEWAVAERKYELQPLTDIRLHSALENEIAPTFNIVYIQIMIMIAAFILLIACINFMNLATARAIERAKEVGLRKVIGAAKKELMLQFFSESLFYAFAGLALALLLVQLSLPTFNQLIGKSLMLDLFATAPLPLGLLILTIFTGIFAGSYPAVFLSKFRPAQVLKGKGSSGNAGRSSNKFRATLVTFQFAISIALIIAAFMIQDQLTFLQNKRLGFEKENVIIMPVRDETVQANWQAIKNSLGEHPQILSITATSTIPGKERDIAFPIAAEGLAADTELNMQTILVDHDFLNAFNIELTAGRGFSEAFPSDKAGAFILNQSAVRKLNWQSPLGKKFAMKHINEGKQKEGEVIGVIEDFHFKSLYHEIEPLVLQIAVPEYYLDNIAVRVAPGSNISAVLEFLKDRWASVVPHRPFEFTFLDDDLQQAYLQEQKLSQIFTYFAGLAIFIACLGLFGLASFSAAQRTKEIGIRKVLGASVGSLALMLSREFTRFVLIANIIAWPLAFYAMREWLSGFAYHIDISWGIFALAALSAFLIAVLTVSYQAIKASLKNPVKALRYE